MITSTINIILLIVVSCLAQISVTVSRDENHFDPDTLQINTKLFRIKGKIETIVKDRKVRSFLGIPYAMPPLGRLRYLSTQPLKSSRGFSKFKRAFWATQFGAQCPQTDDHESQGIPMSENCLNVNVWTPLDASEKRQYPVMFFVHGSGFAYGSNARSTERGDYFASMENVVVVSPNHRLGFLGTAYAATDDMPGNQMIYDHIMALQWTQENVAAFGGNPNDVTLVGLSSSAIMSSIILVSPMVPYGLFHKVILMSGVALGPALLWSKEKSLKETKIYAAKLNCLSESQVNETRPLNGCEIRCLRRKSMESIIDAFVEKPSAMYGDPLMPLSLNDALEVSVPVRGYPMLIGLEDNEDIWSSEFSGKTKLEAFEYFKNFMSSDANISEKSSEIKSILDEFYFKTIPENDTLAIRSALSDAVSDSAFHCTVSLFIELLAPYNKIFFYVNYYPLAKKEEKATKLRAKHADSTHMIMGNAFRFFNQYNDTDRQVSKGLRKVFGDFIRTGQTFWPAAYTANGTVQLVHWNVKTSMDQSPNSVSIFSKEQVCKKWNQVWDLRVPDS